jgi:pimeloyl-ACP methyl ester carboxylesterase
VAFVLAQLRAITSGGLHEPDDLSSIKIPVLVANGDKDVMVSSEHSAGMTRRLPNARLRIYPNSGHGGVFQYHRAFVAEALEFLGEPASAETPVTSRGRQAKAEA